MPSLPDEAAMPRLIGAVPFEQNDERQTSDRRMMTGAFARIDREEIDPVPGMATKTLILPSGHPEKDTGLTEVIRQVSGRAFWRVRNQRSICGPSGYSVRSGCRR